ncbi:MAG: hypothetical protein JXR95_16600 [Deltaproteobacteria bacterium]|nr:hypothetical protein [Deltaproteobacteria bacterium]
MDTVKRKKFRLLIFYSLVLGCLTGVSLFFVPWFSGVKTEQNNGFSIKYTTSVTPMTFSYSRTCIGNCAVKQARKGSYSHFLRLKKARRSLERFKKIKNANISMVPAIEKEIINFSRIAYTGLLALVFQIWGILFFPIILFLGCREKIRNTRLYYFFVPLLIILSSIGSSILFSIFAKSPLTGHYSPGIFLNLLSWIAYSAIIAVMVIQPKKIS